MAIPTPIFAIFSENSNLRGCSLRFGRDENGRIALFQIVLGLMCPGGPFRRGESQNGAKSRRFGMDMPSRAFYEG